MPQSPTSYDEVPYPGYAHSQTHPDRLAAIAMLFGMVPAPVENCRVLELGCGDGSNLVPMAACLTRSEFLGIDLAERPIAAGQAVIETLGLQNIVLRPLDLMKFDSSDAPFDFIIAHGIYSWVPPAVQDRILSICKACLSPQGVAFISFNTYPGCHLRKMVREMMLFHVRQFKAPQEQLNQAISLLDFLTAAVGSSSEADSADPDFYRIFLQQELNRARRYEPGHLYHDDLALLNSPVYVTQFLQHAQKHGLQFLGEADFFEMHYDSYPAPIVKALREMENQQVVLKEQYLDFIKCRRFRQTLLCHDDISLNRESGPGQVTRLSIASRARAVSTTPSLAPGQIQEFRGIKHGVMATDYPLAKAAMFLLHDIYPRSLPFAELLARADDRLNGGHDHESPTGEQELVLAEILLKTYAAGLVELHAWEPDFVLDAGERPRASPLARLQSRSRTVVTTARHENLELEEGIQRQLLLLLDGSRDRSALLRELTAILNRGPGSGAEMDMSLEVLETYLQVFATSGLLST